MDELLDIVNDLIMSQPYYGYFLMNMNKVVDDSLETLAVCFIDDKLTLKFNPKFLSGLVGRQNKIDALKHEILHVMSNHLARYVELGGANVEEFNIAADLAVNEYLPNLGAKIPVVKDGKETYFQPYTVKNMARQWPGLNRFDSAEYYLKRIAQKPPDQKAIKKKQTLDSHEEWTNYSTDAEYITEASKKFIEKTVADTEKHGGVIPAEANDAIVRFNKASVDWKRILKNFVSRNSSTTIESTRKKRNRRYGIMYPGMKKLRLPNIIAAVDTSGSIGMDEREQYLSELFKIVEGNANVTVLEFDDKVHTEYVLKRKRKEFPINSCGGTLFKPVFDKINKEYKDHDLVLFLTDGEAFDCNKIARHGRPVLWGITGAYCYDRFKIKWGQKLRVKMAAEKE